MTDNVGLAVFDPLKAAIVELQEKDEKLVFDHTTPSGEKELRSYVGRLRSHKAVIAATHKTAKAGILDVGRKLDAMKNELTEGVQEIIVTRMKPLDDIAEAKRAEAEAERLEAERIKAERIAAIQKKEEELEAREKKANAKEEQLQRDTDKLETANQAETNAQQREKLAIDAERGRVAKIEADKQAEKDRLAEIERERVENEDHRTMIETETYSYLKEIIEDVPTAYRVMDALRDGNIPNVTLNYQGAGPCRKQEQ